MDFFYLGYIHKNHGTEGELLALLDTDNPQHYQKITSLFLEVKGNYIPYMVEKIKITGNKATLKLKDIDNPGTAALLKGCSIHLPAEFLPKLQGNQFYYHEVTGFAVEDKNRGYIGSIEHIIDQSTQAILQIQYENKEILIPITDEIIQRVDRKNKRIYIDAPAGLIDIYL